VATIAILRLSAKHNNNNLVSWNEKKAEGGSSAPSPLVYLHVITRIPLSSTYPPNMSVDISDLPHNPTLTHTNTITKPYQCFCVIEDVDPASQTPTAERSSKDTPQAFQVALPHAIEAWHWL
jgi:hypothetical protein